MFFLSALPRPPKTSDLHTLFCGRFMKGAAKARFITMKDVYIILR